MRNGLFFIFMTFLVGCSAFAAEKPSRPNVVLMMADDMGMGDTSAFQDFTGNSDAQQLHTPQMDRLARLGVRFTDAHTPSSRCTPTRYGLLTGRYPWRNRLKYWVLFGAQGDPMIEKDRPTLATLFRDQGYGTAMVGKWHVGLRYRKSDGSPADAWDDADLTQPLYDTPLDHGFDYARFTSRSHGTSGPQPGPKNKPEQSIGPGHIHGRDAVGATDKGKQLVEKGPNAYILNDLGGRHSDHAIAYLDQHLGAKSTSAKPFFLYYASNSNHAPHTPDTDINGEPVVGAGRNVAGEKMNTRSDFVYENDVALGRLLDYLKDHNDPRRPGHKLIENTVVIFTSDNGAEIKDKFATGPFRSHKGSVYEGGHRVPFIVAWPEGHVGDGKDATPGQTSEALLGLHDMYATFSEILGVPLPDLRAGEKGGEDSVSVLAAWRGGKLANRPMIYNDHSEAKDKAASALRLDDPLVGGKIYKGKWKLFFDASLLRKGEANPVELFDLATDQCEANNRIDEPGLKALVQSLCGLALTHRNSGGHRLAEFAPKQRLVFDWRAGGEADLDEGTFRVSVAKYFDGKPAAEVMVSSKAKNAPKVKMTVRGVKGNKSLEAATFSPNPRGLGLSGGNFKQVDDGEALVISFDRDVLIESASIEAGNGACGGFYRVGDKSPLAIYCIDADNDLQDQTGILSDIGVLKAGETLRLDSTPHYGADPAGAWRLGALTLRVLDN